jgi:hypothetical protein
MSLLTNVGLIGVGAYLLSRGTPGSSVSSPVTSTTSNGETVEGEVFEEGEMVSESPDGSEILVAGLDNGHILEIPVGGGLVHIYEKVGEVLVEGSTSIPDKATASVMGMSCYNNTVGMGKSNRMRTLKPINMSYPDVNDCEVAGRVLAKWRWSGKGGPATKYVRRNARVLASTPCEVFKKVGYGEMSADAGGVHLLDYYKGNKYGSADSVIDNLGKPHKSYTRSRRRDS